MDKLLSFHKEFLLKQELFMEVMPEVSSIYFLNDFPKIRMTLSEENQIVNLTVLPDLADNKLELKLSSKISDDKLFNKLTTTLINFFFEQFNYFDGIVFSVFSPSAYVNLSKLNPDIEVLEFLSDHFILAKSKNAKKVISLFKNDHFSNLDFEYKNFSFINDFFYSLEEKVKVDFSFKEGEIYIKNMQNNFSYTPEYNLFSFSSHEDIEKNFSFMEHVKKTVDSLNNEIDSYYKAKKFPISFSRSDVRINLTNFGFSLTLSTFYNYEIYKEINKLPLSLFDQETFDDKVEELKKTLLLEREFFDNIFKVPTLIFEKFFNNLNGASFNYSIDTVQKNYLELNQYTFKVCFEKIKKSCSFNLKISNPKELFKKNVDISKITLKYTDDKNEVFEDALENIMKKVEKDLFSFTSKNKLLNLMNAKEENDFPFPKNNFF